MTLDPVHFEGIASLARSIGRSVDDGDHQDIADTVFTQLLDPLTNAPGDVVLEPLGDVRKRYVDIEDAALQADEFPTRHGLDSGTINPTSFKNGVVLDVAQAAMSATPTDLDLHRSRSIVATVHVNDQTLPDLDLDWVKYDNGYSRRRLLHAPHVNRYAEGVVHALSLYYAESEHAHEYADEVNDLLMLDGPIYPKEVLTWEDRHPDLADKLAEETTPQRIVQNYVRLVERFADRDVPLVGFVKNPASKFITRTIRQKQFDAHWVDDAAFFTQVLERGGHDGEMWTRRKDQLTFTNWFVSKGGADGAFVENRYASDYERSFEDYEVTFFVVYDPRDDVLFKIEAPRVFTERRDVRERLERQVLADIAHGRGPPLAIEKADELARISIREKEALRRKIEEVAETEQSSTYDDVRWGTEG